MHRAFPRLAFVAACAAFACAAFAACASTVKNEGTSAAGVTPETCALASACPGFGSLTTFGGLCQVLSSGPSGPLATAQWSCIETAHDCVSYEACFTVPASAADVCDGGTQGRCSGSYAVMCGSGLVGGRTQGDDCGSAGLVCEEDDLGAACGTGACDADTTNPTCDGDNLITCTAGALSPQDCKYWNDLGCGSTPDGGTACQTQVAETCAVVAGQAQCVGTGPACDAATFPNACDGTTIVSCTGGREARFDCTLQSPAATCQIQSDGSAQCVGAGTQCTEATAETCDDGVIGYCMWGTKATVDCKAYGLSGCRTFTAQDCGGGSTTGAACTP